MRDTGRDGDRSAGDGLYSGYVAFNPARFQRQMRAALERLPAANLTPPPAISTRFTPVGKTGARGSQLAGTALRSVPPAALRESLLRDSRQAVAAIADPGLRRSREAFRIERERGVLTARIFGLGVPINLFFTGTVLPGDINPDRSLVITDLAVVRDPSRTFDLCQGFGNPNGVWTFKHLVTQMANTSQTGITPEQFVWNWLSLSAFPQEANNIISNPRPAYVAKIRDDWVNFQGGNTTQILDLDRAPFRLLAIVARPDLGSGGSGYGGGSAGELRFVFGVLDPAGPCSSPPQSTVIFEYRVDRPTCSAIKGWTESWFDLSDSGLVLGGSYNQAVEQLTQQVVVAGANPSQEPNHNAISQIRTNDLIGGPWMLFEYRLIQSVMTNAGNLDLDTVKQTPSITFHSGSGQTQLAAWLNANQPAILANSHTVPTSVAGGVPFLGADAPTNNNVGFTWTNTPGVTGASSAQVLKNFSTATCNGCHAGDTGTDFTHIKPRPQGAPAQLSTFMLEPNDLNDSIEDDIERRQRFMADSLNSQCFFIHLAMKLPKAFVH